MGSLPEAPSPDDAATPGGQSDDESGEELGFFRSWGSLYFSVIVYTGAMILLLYWFTVALDFRIS